MLSRIRNTVRVLSAPPISRYEEPDLAFEEEVSEANATSRFIASLFEILIISLVVGVVLAPFLSEFLAAKKTANVTTVTAVVVALMAILLEHVRMGVISKLREKFNIHQAIAPLFGHKITKTLRTLRG